MLLADAFVEFTFAKDWTPESLRWYRGRLGAFFDYCRSQGVEELEEVDAPLVRRYLDYRRPGLSSHTLHGHARAAKAFLNWAAQDELISDKIARRVKLPVKEHYVIQTLTPDMVARLMDAAGKTETPMRDKAILSLLLDTGCRASELTGLTLDRTVLSVDDSFVTVKGKGRRDREISLGAKSRQALARYLHRDRHGDAPWLILNRTGGRLRPEGLDRLLYRLRDTAGREHFQGVRVSAHTFRHTYAVSFLQNGGDVYKLSRILGHAAITTTELYLKSFQARDARRTSTSVLDAMGKVGR